MLDKRLGISYVFNLYCLQTNEQHGNPEGHARADPKLQLNQMSPEQPPDNKVAMSSSKVRGMAKLNVGRLGGTLHLGHGTENCTDM